jgi:hypothetical protein
MKSSKLKLVKPPIKRCRTQERAKNNIIIKLPKDIQMKLVCFLTLSETLKLTQCSSCINAAFTVEEVWAELLQRVSPSIPTLPMNSLASKKNRLKLVLGNRNQIQCLDYSKLKLHYILEIMGNKHISTLCNPITDVLSAGNRMAQFACGKDFGYYVPYHRSVSASLIVLLIYEGKTSVLLPRCYLMANHLIGNDAVFFFNRIPSDNDWSVKVVLAFNWTKNHNEDSKGQDYDPSGEEFDENPGYFTGVQSVYFDVQISSLIEFLSNILTWY